MRLFRPRIVLGIDVDDLERTRAGHLDYGRSRRVDPMVHAGLHRHVSYYETHSICEGRYEARLGTKTLQLSAGDIFFAPRGTPHSIKCLGPETGRELMISSPGGVFDAFIDEVVTSMTTSGSPTGGPVVDFRAIAAKHGIEFLS